MIINLVLLSSAIESYPQTGGLTEQIKNSDFVLIGTVKELRNTPAKYTEKFHSLAVIDVDTVLKGKLKHKEIIIRLKSGPVTDGNEADWIIVSEEPKFFKDQRCVLFLNRSSTENFPENTFAPNFWQVFEVKGRVINYFGREYKEEEFIKIIIHY